jgi:hypothetical protein
MPVTLICPSCKNTITVHLESTKTCASCGAEFPEDLLRTIETQLGSQKNRRPILLTIGLFATAFFGLLYLLFLVLAPLGFGDYSINGEQVSGGEFMRKVGVIWGIQGLLLLATSYGIWKEQTWSRHVFMFYLLTSAAMTIPLLIKADAAGSLILNLIFYVIGFVLAGWYLYLKGNVKGYYAYLEGKKTGG